MNSNNQVAYYHLPGLFEFYDFYKVFLPLFYSHREYFYDWCSIGSIYGAPSDCLWSGGRISFAPNNYKEVIELVEKYNISSRLTFSNSLLEDQHLDDERCNMLCKEFNKSTTIPSGVIVASDILADYLLSKYPNMYLVSSTTKVLTHFYELVEEINNEKYQYVVADFRLNKRFDKLDSLNSKQKDKLELLCNECCSIGCKDRKACYESVSKMNLSDDEKQFECTAIDSKDGYRFSKAMKNPAFISLNGILHLYLPKGITNFKIEGRGLGSALLLEFILYYMTKPEYQLVVREEIYLDNQLDLF